jgi:hypothetical protein
MCLYGTKKLFIRQKRIGLNASLIISFMLTIDPLVHILNPDQIVPIRIHYH